VAGTGERFTAGKGRPIHRHRFPRPIALLLLIAPPLLLACRTEGLYRRLSEDYVPFDRVNARWVYKVAGEDTTTVEWTVKSRLAFEGRDASLIGSTRGDFYYAVAGDGLSEYVSRSVFAFGEEILLEARWRPRVERPLALGSRWEDVYTGEVVERGVTFGIESSLTGVVEAIETVFTPVDFFEECYRVDLDIRSRITMPTGEVEETSASVTEWYAPGVGMVKRVVDGTETWELTDFFVL
jgi:hypothetical protein